MTAYNRRSRQGVNIWPGFVDALAALLMVVIFLLMVFMLSQFYLRETLSGRDKALENLHIEISELAEFLSLEQQANADLRLNLEQLSSELQSSVSESDQMSSKIGELTAALRLSEESISDLNQGLTLSQEQLATLEARLADAQTHNAQTRNDLAEKEKNLAKMTANYKGSEDSLIEERQLSERQRDELSLLNRQLAALREQLATLTASLDSAEKKDEQNQVKISDLGKRLNVALAGKVQELTKYRSEFFGRLRELLGDHSDISIVGDRFVFQSEVLFDSGSATLEAEGTVQLNQLALTLLEIARDIPSDIDWILRVDGHTDLVPISNERYRSNWELSAGRAISVVKFLIEQGVPANRLAAVGFGEFSPLDPKKDAAAYRRNRRIEIKLTQR
ncbi:MAG: peptidoglycan -binding protein [Rhodospirillaceae bacterium]|jgi:chemotaxis protein MotB|nr:peptidoglycan -binding protein [Rhodospirillaceae bacterium]MBT5659615.1 peptidoglycan -binding protein [Rhodospirillaceae bacterium]MBT5752099.1 peptidoglycan -binding protein [Rhodospirillaceae bacterium]